jgi:hypothetical protein
MEEDTYSSNNAALLFVLVTRLYVHYKFKTREVFEPAAVLLDDDYAREVLHRVRAVADAQLQEMAARFEAARFPRGAALPAAREPAKAASPAKDEPMLDFPLENAS